MAWVETVAEDAAEGELKSIYDAQRQQAGAVANILKVHSLSPAILEAHLRLYSAVMHAPGHLSRRQREMIAVAVVGDERMPLLSGPSRGRLAPDHK